MHVVIIRLNTTFINKFQVLVFYGLWYFINYSMASRVTFTLIEIIETDTASIRARSLSNNQLITMIMPQVNNFLTLFYLALFRPFFYPHH